MASVKNLKKEINYVFGDILNIVYVWEMTTIGKPSEESDKIVDGIYDTFDGLMNKINQKGIENKKAHFKQIRKEFEHSANEYVAQVNELK